MNNELLIKMITDSWREQLIATNKIFDNLSDEESIHEVSPTIGANMKHSLQPSLPIWRRSPDL